ncbi:MAG: NF038129 family PEP-CTERM protein [Acidobacteriaceae bacterium]|nr:NF038129 family PEP-CTERM protein [Acidobacteriaceae bacterium]
MRKVYLFGLFLFVAAGCALQGDQLLTVSLDTGTLNGTVGSLDLAFDAGALSSQDATVQILNFTGATFAGVRQTTGAVTGGPLGSAPITINNSTSYGSNDEFESVTFGRSLSFTLVFGGPAVNSPSGGNTSTSQFAFYTYADANGSVPVLTGDPSGLSGLVTINLNGSLSTSVISPNLTFAVPVPEPAAFWLLGGAFGLLSLKRLLRHS